MKYKFEISNIKLFKNNKLLYYMSDGGIIAGAIITGGCGIFALFCQYFLFKKKNNEIRCCINNCPCLLNVPERPYPTDVLNTLYEPVHNKNNYIYTSKINNNQQYLVNILPNLKMLDKDDNIVDDGSVNIFKEILSKPYNGTYYMELILTNVSQGYVKLFIKRFKKNWSYSERNFLELVDAEEGYNRLFAESKIGEEDIAYEQIGVMILSDQTLNENTHTCKIERAYIGIEPYEHCICLI